MSAPASVVASKPLVAAAARPAAVAVKKPLPSAPVDPKAAARQAFAEGRVSLAELEGVGPQLLEGNARLAQRLMAAGQLDAAMQVYLGLVALEPREAHFHLGCGAVCLQKGQWADADAWFTRALERNKALGAALAYRGEVRLHLGNLKGAVADLQAALKADPECRQAPTARARGLLVALLQKSRTTPSVRGAA